jgi:hypothetical protein
MQTLGHSGRPAIASLSIFGLAHADSYTVALASITTAGPGPRRPSLPWRRTGTRKCSRAGAKPLDMPAEEGGVRSDIQFKKQPIPWDMSGWSQLQLLLAGLESVFL